jgi:hypothetical protein
VGQAWVNLRRRRYFVGSYSDTPDITIVGPPPYAVLSEDCAPEELGATVRTALRTSAVEQVSWDDALRLADERILQLARLAGVKDRRTFERGVRLVDAQCDQRGVTVTPHFRKRGYWEPSPESLWLHLDAPPDRVLGVAVKKALERASA